MGFMELLGVKKDPMKEAIKRKKRAMYDKELEKAMKYERYLKNEREVARIKRMAHAAAIKKVNKPSGMERIQRIADNMEKASGDYNRFFAPYEEKKKKTQSDIPDFR